MVGACRRARRGTTERIKCDQGAEGGARVDRSATKGGRILTVVGLVVGLLGVEVGATVGSFVGALLGPDVSEVGERVGLDVAMVCV